jgi:hypothetical protein
VVFKSRPSLRRHPRRILLPTDERRPASRATGSLAIDAVAASDLRRSGRSESGARAPKAASGQRPTGPWCDQASIRSSIRSIPLRMVRTIVDGSSRIVRSIGRKAKNDRFADPFWLRRGKCENNASGGARRKVYSLHARGRTAPMSLASKFPSPHRFAVARVACKLLQCLSRDASGEYEWRLNPSQTIEDLFEIGRKGMDIKSVSREALPPSVLKDKGPRSLYNVANTRHGSELNG